MGDGGVRTWSVGWLVGGGAAGVRSLGGRSVPRLQTRRAAGTPPKYVWNCAAAAQRGWAQRGRSGAGIAGAV